MDTCSAEESWNMSTTSFFYHIIPKAKNREEVPFMIPGNLQKKFENFTKCINTKGSNLLKDTMNHINEMNSDFLSTQRGYPDVSNSKASYLIGGFVGSKSQMNNEKHQMSYDLGGAIFKILQDCKCDRPYNKLREEKKFQTNKIEKRQDCKDSNEFYKEVMFCNNITIRTNDTKTKPNSEISDFQNENEVSTYPNCENEEICHLPIPEHLKCDIKTILTSECKGDKLNHVDMCLDTSLSENFPEERRSSICSENQLVSDNYLNNASKQDELDCNDISEPVLVDSLIHVNCWSLGIRGRQFSECSVESTDSDSFIIFDDKCYIEHQSSKLHESDNDESDYYFGENCTYEDDDDDNYDDDEEEDDDCWTEANDECDNGIEDREVAEANARWSEIYKDVDHEVESSNSRVRFRDDVKVHRMVMWEYAYRAARPGPWEQMAHDRGRFKERIQRLSCIISPILQQSHRTSIYNKLYA